MFTDTLIADKIGVFVTVSVDVTRFSVHLVYIIGDLIVNNVINYTFYGVFLLAIQWLVLSFN